ncbi:MAG: hypothetical protein ACFNLH_08955 [Corynebacterium matruchotii]
MRWVRTRVLPDPAPAMMSRGAPAWVTAASWAGLRPRMSSAGSETVTPQAGPVGRPEGAVPSARARAAAALACCRP